MQRGGMDKPPIFARLAATTALSIFIMNIIGSYVSARGAGMACPDWPLCPPLTNPLIVLEFLHRAWGGIASFVALLTLIAAARHRTSNSTLSLAKRLIYIASGILIAQIILGAVVVFSWLTPELVATHQGLAMTIFALYVASASISLIPVREGA